LQICTFANSCNLQHCNFLILHASAIHARRDRMHISCVVFLQHFIHILQICSLGCLCAICRCARFWTLKSQLANLQVCRDGNLQICTSVGQHVQCEGAEHLQIMHFRGNRVVANLITFNCAGLQVRKLANLQASVQGLLIVVIPSGSKLGATCWRPGISLP
jgi:hypothetical protein